MPFQIYDEGKASEVAGRVRTLTQGQGELDTALFETAREFAVKTLEALKPDLLVKLDAGGTHVDGRLTLRFNLYTK